MAVKTVTIIIQERPYGNNDKAWNALRFAGAALAEDMGVRVFLLDAGIDVGRQHHKVPEGKTDLEVLIKGLMNCSLEVQTCGLCIDACGIGEGDLIAGIRRGSMKSLAGWVKSSSHVLTF